MITNQYKLSDLPQFLHSFNERFDLDLHDSVLLQEAIKILESQPINMGHFDAIEGALTSAMRAMSDGAQTREWDSLQAAMGAAWSDIQRAIGYVHSLKKRVPEGDGFAE